MVKLPYTTGREWIKFPKTKNDVLKAIRCAQDKYGERIHYAMVQPCLPNRKEYRVVVYNGKPTHIAKVGHSKGKAFGCELSLFEFAANAVQALYSACPSTQKEGTIRVDIMQMGFMAVVNEFEGLEANISCKDARLDSGGRLNMINFWVFALFSNFSFFLSLFNSAFRNSFSKSSSIDNECVILLSSIAKLLMLVLLIKSCASLSLILTAGAPEIFAFFCNHFCLFFSIFNSAFRKAFSKVSFIDIFFLEASSMEPNIKKQLHHM